jgi:hypothetical protein
MVRAIGLGALLWGGAAVAEGPETAPFDFLVMGCMPYHFPADDARFRNLIAAANALAPAFSVHLGDIKSGKTPCSDENLARVRGYFDTFAHPLIYSVGDNEWTDCDRPECGGFDPLERLAHLRGLFFAAPGSLGASPMPLASQREDPAHGTFVENTRWSRGGVTFAALHVVGSNNNLLPDRPGSEAEFRARDAANLAWLRETFAEARASGSIAVGLFIQANPFDQFGGPRDTGYTAFVDALREETLAFGRPVVLFHADSHYFRIDKPLRVRPGGPIVERLTRVESFGAENMHLVRVTVNPSEAADPFTVRPLLVEGNRHTP